MPLFPRLRSPIKRRWRTKKEMNLRKLPGIATTILRTHEIGRNGENGKQCGLSNSLICRYVTLTVSLAILVANFGTSIISPGLPDIAADFGVGIEVGILSISLYLIGFGMYPHRTGSNTSRWSTFCCSIIGRIWTK